MGKSVCPVFLKMSLNLGTNIEKQGRLLRCPSPRPTEGISCSQWQQDHLGFLPPFSACVHTHTCLCTPTAAHILAASSLTALACYFLHVLILFGGFCFPSLLFLLGETLLSPTLHSDEPACLLTFFLWKRIGP